MPKPNYGYEKRQRELEKKRKKDAKAARKSQDAQPAQPAPQDAAKPSDPAAA